eukprot:6121871-Amphidinium_carterae.1
MRVHGEGFQQVARPKTVASDQTSRAVAICGSRTEWASLALVGAVIEVTSASRSLSQAGGSHWVALD